MSNFTFAISTLLTLAGIGCAVVGVAGSEWKPFAIGLVFILGAGVFATLYAGSRFLAKGSTRGDGQVTDHSD